MRSAAAPRTLGCAPTSLYWRKNGGNLGLGWGLNLETLIMKISTLLASVVVAGFVATGALAQTATPSPSTPPAATTAPAKAKTPQTAVSQACSAQADAKGLHGKDRKKFRQSCKKSGGKAG